MFEAPQVPSVTTPTAEMNQLVRLVKTMRVALVDVFEAIEEQAYMLCEAGEFEYVAETLANVAAFYESFEYKNEEIVRDLVDLYILIGEIFQFHQEYQVSLIWFHKASVIDDRNPASYHAMAISHEHMRNVPAMIKCLQYEVCIAPGNYHSYLLLSQKQLLVGDLDGAENTLKLLLERNPDNIDALHQLICVYELQPETVDCRFLRKRIIGRQSPQTLHEKLILSYHLCCMQQFERALHMMQLHSMQYPEHCIVSLVIAHIYGEAGYSGKKRETLALFRKHTIHRPVMAKSAIEEFEQIFGTAARENLLKRLHLSNPSHPELNQTCEG